MTDPDAVRRSTLAAHAVDHLAAFAEVVERPAASGEGPLAGMPFAVKDMIDTAGVPTRYGSRFFRDHVPTATAPVVQRLLDAGGVLVGKTTTHEFAFGVTGDNFDGGPARNPLDPERIAGGSSCGSAVAVAAGVVPFALGTDTGGSARIPAALCGTVGFRPTTGVLPAEGVFPLATTLDTVGVLASDMDVLAMAWRALSGQPSRVHEGAVRVGVLPSASLGPVAPGVAAVVGTALAGFDTVEVGFPPLAEFATTYAHIQGPEAYRVHRARVEDAAEVFQPDVLERLRASQEVTGWQYVEALDAQRRLQRECAAVFDAVDLLALPTVPVVAPLIGQQQVDLPGGPQPTRATLLRLTAPFSVLGWPALSVPCGESDGLPVGLQLVGRPGSDAELLAMARRLVPRG